MKKCNKTRFVILGLLTIKPLSGYDIKKWIKTSISYFWSESNGQLYPALNQLAKEELIVVSDNQSKGKKVRTAYAITQKGKIELRKWLRGKDEKSLHRDEKLLKLFFGKNMTVKESIQLLRKREEQLKENLAEYLPILKRIEEVSASPHRIYWLLTLKNGISSAESEISWCRESIKILENSKREELKI